MGLWTSKMVYLVPTQYFLIQLQLINHFFSLTNERGVSDKTSVTMHSSIIIFACFIYFKSLSVLPFAAVQKHSLVVVERSHVLTFELPKTTLSCCDGCRIFQEKLAYCDNFIYHSLLSQCLKLLHVVYCVIEFNLF